MRVKANTRQADGGAYLWERCYYCGHRLRFSATGCPQCGMIFDGRRDPKKWPDKCGCERCMEARDAKG
jgi:hypothetical protein